MPRPSVEADAPGDVIVVGEALIDIVESAGEPVREYVGGSPANVALGLGRLGVGVRLHTALARDARGERIAHHLADSGVRVDQASWMLPSTSTARARIGRDGSADYEFELEWALPHPPRWYGEQVAHVGSVAAFLTPGAEAVAKFVREVAGRAMLTFDPNIRPALIGPRQRAIAGFEDIASHARVVKLSDEDAAWLYPDWPADRIADRLIGLGAAAVVLTCGADGAVAFAGETRVALQAPRVKVKDTVGAGDTAMAALIDGLLHQGPHADLGDADTLEALVAHAIAASSVTVQRAGADLPVRSEVDRAARAHAMQLAVQQGAGHGIF